MQKGKLLIVDDDRKDCETLRHIAELSGYEVITSDTAISFFEQLALFEPDVIIVDLVQPPPAGASIIARLAELHSASRLIITSGLGDGALEAAALSAAENNLVVLGTLEKPFSAQRLRQLLSLHGTRAGHRGVTTDSWLEQLGSEDRLPSSDELVDVVEKDLITLSYQPKIACDTGRLMGFEALARWDIPGEGPVIPSVFVPMAENFDLIEALTYNTLRQGIRWFGELRDSPLARSLAGANGGNASEMTLSFNVSARVLPDMNLPEELEELCETYSVPTSSIILEISESNTMRDPTDLLEILTRFRLKQFRLSIDDFGTGFSSMLHLVRLPFTELKIDRTFISEAGSSEEARSVVRCTIDLAHSLGLETVAEGVESEEVRQMLTGYGCDSFQGYLVSRPLSAPDIKAWLQRYSEQLTA